MRFQEDQCINFILLDGNVANTPVPVRFNSSSRHHESIHVRQDLYYYNFSRDIMSFYSFSRNSLYPIADRSLCIIICALVYILHGLASVIHALRLLRSSVREKSRVSLVFLGSPLKRRGGMTHSGPPAERRKLASPIYKSTMSPKADFPSVLT
jgi:hypothetical protein